MSSGLYFKTVRWKNLLSTGNTFLEIPLNRNPITALAGISGSGKSQILDALFFCLFNRPFRDINKAQLINSLNEKACVAEVELEKAGKFFLIRRGMKPNLFEIHCKGILLNQDAAVKDYQKYLEDQILGMNHKTAAQLVVLGAASYIPFMQLKAADRRAFIEKLLDCEVFSTMAVLTKQKLSILKTDISSKETELQIAENNLIGQKKLVDTLKAEAESKLAQLKADKKEQEGLQAGYENEIEEITTSIEKLKTSIEDEQENTEEEKRVRKELADLETQKRLLAEFKVDNTEKIQVLQKKIEAQEAEVSEQEALSKSLLETMGNKAKEIDELKSSNTSLDAVQKRMKLNQENIAKVVQIRLNNETSLKFYREHEQCPECKQDITAEFKEKTQQEKAQKIEQCNLAKQKLDKEQSELQEEVEQIAVKNAEIVKLEKEWGITNNSFVNTSEYIKKLLSQIAIRNNEIEALKLPKKSENLLTEEQIVEQEQGLKDQELDISQRKQVIDKTKQTITQEEKNLAVSKNSLKNTIAHLVRIEKEISDLTSKQSRAAQEEKGIVKFEKEIKSKKTELENFHHQKTVHEIIAGFLKDDGVKAAIVKQYIPAINNHVNRFLAAMDFFVRFNIDEEFNEVISSHGRDDFSYMNFSEGEKQRIDIALLFTWRMIAKMKNSVATNLLILDEVLDSHLSTEAAENVISMLSSETFKGSNIFLISHKEAIVDKFDNVISFSKERNFSQIN